MTSCHLTHSLLVLVVSFGGFIFLAFTVYSIVLTKLKSRKEIEEEEQELNYEERLVAADVSTLNRAQRRAPRGRQFRRYLGSDLSLPERNRGRRCRGIAS